MERRADPGSDVNESKEDSKAWQAVRRTLGRLFSRVGVREVGDAERTMTVLVKHGALASPPPQFSPRGGWKPSAASALAAVPTAGTGLRESDLLPRVFLASGDYALRPPVMLALPSASATAEVQTLGLDWPVEVTALPESFVRLPSAPVRTQTTALLGRPKTAPLQGWAIVPPPVRLLRLPRVDEPRVRWGGDSVLRRMPLTRRSRLTGGGHAERRRLAETVHLAPDEVALLGVYPDVPILAVERIVVEDEGRRLKLWLRPEVLRGRSASHRITLLVGRQTATGKMLQAAL